MGNIYIPTTPDELPVEKEKVAIGMYGKEEDFFTLKGVVVELLDKLGIRNTLYLHHP